MIVHSCEKERRAKMTLLPTPALHFCTYSAVLKSLLPGHVSCWVRRPKLGFNFCTIEYVYWFQREDSEVMEDRESKVTCPKLHTYYQQARTRIQASKFPHLCCILLCISASTLHQEEVKRQENSSLGSVGNK